MAANATKQDLIDLFRPLSPEEQERAQPLLDTVSDILRNYAHKVGKDLDQMIEADDSGALAATAKAVVVNIVARTLNTPVAGDMASLSQYSQSGLGYTVSGTFVAGGRTIFIMKSELADLGLRRQKFGVINFECGGEKCFTESPFN